MTIKYAGQSQTGKNYFREIKGSRDAMDFNRNASDFKC